MVLWKVFFVLNFGLTLILLFPLFFILLSRKSWFPKAFMLMKFWARIILYIPGIRFKVKYETKLSPSKTYVYVSNHSSYLDIVLSYCAIPYYFVFMGKDELRKAPLFNIFFKEMNILVDRKSNIGSHRSLEAAGKKIDEGQSLMLFPEGTISREAPKLRAFKNGAFKLAIEKQVPVVPITFINNWKLLQDRPFLQGLSRPGLALVEVHRPIPTKGMTLDDLLALKAQVENVIDKSLINYDLKKKRK
jgi:1-acyl-sn-glycerol-3-phosphate acyltransferase